jgi:hypothetical protein
MERHSCVMNVHAMHNSLAQLGWCEVSLFDGETGKHSPERGHYNVSEF